MRRGLIPSVFTVDFFHRCLVSEMKPCADETVHAAGYLFQCRWLMLGRGPLIEKLFGYVYNNYSKRTVKAGKGRSCSKHRAVPYE